MKKNRDSIQSTMDEFVQAFGGRLVSSVIPFATPSFPNADYIFEDENVIGELKLLTKDMSDDPHQRKRIESLLRHYLKNPGHFPYFAGRRKISSKDCSEEYQNAIGEILARPIRAHITKANRQIRGTKRFLNRPDSHGLLLLGNEGNSQLKTPHVFDLAVRALGKSFHSIYTIVVFTCDELALTPQSRPQISLWICGNRESHPAISQNF